MELDTVTAFTPWTSLSGGILIGISSVKVMILLGKVAGISGINQGSHRGGGARSWRTAGLRLAHRLH